VGIDGPTIARLVARAQLTAAPLAVVAATPTPRWLPPLRDQLMRTNQSVQRASKQETLVFAADLSDQLSLDPAVAYEFGGILVEGQIYETLVSVEPGDPNIKPLLAKNSIDTPSISFWLMSKS
jgi:ABC-type transport system substrate-binding protein